MPKYNFDIGIKKTIEWYFANQEWLKKLRNNNYIKRIGIET